MPRTPLLIAPILVVAIAACSAETQSQAPSPATPQAIGQSATPIDEAAPAVTPITPVQRSPEALEQRNQVLRESPLGARIFDPAYGRGADPAVDAARRELDQLSGQYYGWASGLYWHTDWNAAVASAEMRKLPIISLRLLGQLDDEFC